MEWVVCRPVCVCESVSEWDHHLLSLYSHERKNNPVQNSRNIVVLLPKWYSTIVSLDRDFSILFVVAVWILDMKDRNYQKNERKKQHSFTRTHERRSIFVRWTDWQRKTNKNFETTLAFRKIAKNQNHKNGISVWDIFIHLRHDFFLSLFSHSHTFWVVLVLLFLLLLYNMNLHSLWPHDLFSRYIFLVVIFAPFFFSSPDFFESVRDIFYS